MAALCTHLDNQSSIDDAFVVNLSGTSVTEDNIKKVTSDYVSSSVGVSHFDFGSDAIGWLANKRSKAFLMNPKDVQLCFINCDNSVSVTRGKNEANSHPTPSRTVSVP